MRAWVFVLRRKRRGFKYRGHREIFKELCYSNIHKFMECIKILVDIDYFGLKSGNIPTNMVIRVDLAPKKGMLQENVSLCPLYWKP